MRGASHGVAGRARGIKPEAVIGGWATSLRCSSRIVAFTNPGVPKRSGPSLESCKRSITRFKAVDQPISYALLSETGGFIELRDGRTLNWRLEDHFGVLLVGETMFLAGPSHATDAP